MPTSPPLAVVIAGPNGAGKSTTAPVLLVGALAVQEFVNADTIAQGLSALHPETVALAAGRVMISRMRTLARSRVSFAFETTLASRSFVPWLTALKKDGFGVHVAFLALPAADLAVARVVERVRRGGHRVPENVVRRRFVAGLSNFFSLYEPLADSWQMFDNSAIGGPRIVGARQAGGEQVIYDMDVWERLKEAAR